VRNSDGWAILARAQVGLGEKTLDPLAMDAELMVLACNQRRPLSALRLGFGVATVATECRR